MVGCKTYVENTGLFKHQVFTPWRKKKKKKKKKNMSLFFFEGTPWEAKKKPTVLSSICLRQHFLNVPLGFEGNLSPLESYIYIYFQES